MPIPPPTSGLPRTISELIHAIIPTIAEDLAGELVGTASQDLFLKLAAGTATPSIHGLIRLRVAFEVSALLTEAGMSPAEIQAWWMTDGVLNGVGEDVSPVGVMRTGPLKDAASKILKCARAASGSTAAAYSWEPLTLLTLDVDGVLLPFSEWHSEVATEDFQPFDYCEPPFSARRFFYDTAVVAAVTRWAETEGVLVNWLTSWGRKAPRLLAPQLGLPDVGTFALSSLWERANGRPWKRLALWGFLSDLPPRNPLRLLAIDDLDMRTAGKQLRGMRSEKLLDSFVIEPRSSVGLTAAPIAQVDAFIARGQLPAEPVDPAAERAVYLPTVEAVAVAIREAREAAGLTVEQFAERAGVSLAVVERLESGGMLAGDLDAVVRVLESVGVHAVALPGIASRVELADVVLAAHVEKFGPQ